MDDLVMFVKENCQGWVIVDHSDRHGEADSYGIFHVSDKIARYIAGNMIWVEEGVCHTHPCFGMEEYYKAAILGPMEPKTISGFGYEYWRKATFYPLEKRRELEVAMYERKLISRHCYLRLMQDTELRP